MHGRERGCPVPPSMPLFDGLDEYHTSASDLAPGLMHLASLRSELACTKVLAVQWLLDIVMQLEIRETCRDDAELQFLLTPRSPLTTLRHCRMFKRFRAFYDLDFKTDEVLQSISGHVMLRWIMY